MYMNNMVYIHSSRVCKLYWSPVSHLLHTRVRLELYCSQRLALCTFICSLWTCQHSKQMLIKIIKNISLTLWIRDTFLLKEDVWQWGSQILSVSILLLHHAFLLLKEWRTVQQTSSVAFFVCCVSDADYWNFSVYSRKNFDLWSHGCRFN